MIDWLAYTLVKALTGVCCRLSPAHAVWLGERLGGLGYWLQPKRRQVGVVNLRAAFDGELMPAQAKQIIHNCFKQLGAGFLEMLRLPVIDETYMKEFIEFEGFERLDDAIASGKPVIFLTAHCGNWELSSIVGALKGYPIIALARTQKGFPKLYQLLVSYRESKGCTVVHKGGAMKRLIAALEARKLIGIVGDQASRQGVFVEFFGRDALFSKGAFELAHAKGAIILPTFIRRIRGPFHKITIESPIKMSSRREKPEAMQKGIEQFAGLLSRHIRQDPSQWLWMHKRWKHTPTRRALVISDGKLGHVKQSLAVIEALREKHPDLSYKLVDVRYRNQFGRLMCLLYSWWIPARWQSAFCLKRTLTPECAREFLSRYADVIISCGASIAPVNMLWAAENRAKSIVVMNPTPLPLRRFDLVIAPRHDGLPKRRNVVQTAGALSVMDDKNLRRAQARLQSHPNFRAERTIQDKPSAEKASRIEHRHPVIGVFLGGDTAQYELTPAFAEALSAQIIAACEIVDGWCLVTTSRRTNPAVERMLSERLGRHARCRLLLLASRDPIDGTMEGMLSSADVAVVTGESISMVSEACTSGRRIMVLELPLRKANRSTLTKHQRFLRQLAREGYIRISPVPEVSHAIRRMLNEKHPPKRLDDLPAVREAVAHLL